ncbi:MAG: AraC family transcriptional regulator [Oscillospiraceae bacterium]|jgi:AraC-like DNA-binding protein/ligand-binding sensor protein|nr:AraC family transcriptional regulator [Oscillospiraceae bacterium]
MVDILNEKCKKFQEHFSELLGIDCYIVDIQDPENSTITAQNGVSNFCTHCRIDKKHELATHLYGCNQAHRWNGRYIYYCPLGMTFVAASITGDGGRLVGGMVLGPFVMGELQDTLFDLAVPEMTWEVSRLPVFSTRKVQHVAEIFSSVVAHISGSEHQQIQNLMYDQEKLLKQLYIAKELYADEDRGGADRLLQFEKDLRLTVISGERAEALRMINEMLAQIYVYSNYDFKSVKARLLELLVGLSRATIEAGADAADTFHMSEDFITQIERYTDVDQLAFWISDIVRRFIVQAFDLAQVKHSDVVFKVTNYIKQNCSDKLTLDLLAREVYLSKSYLSSVFKQETGMSLTSYITKVRIEKSKKMLLEDNIGLAAIAGQCGFKDQSYFTKVFKKETGISPKRFRNGYFTSRYA